MNLYPRSFLRLILLGWLLMALPLLVAIAFASLSLARLAERSEATMHQASQAARLGWQMEAEIDDMERLLRQYAVVGAAALLDDHAQLRAAWRRHCDEFSGVPLVAPLRDQVGGLLAREAEAHRAFAAREIDIEAMLVVLGELRDGTFALLEAANRYSEAERQSFRAETDTLREQLLVAIMFAILLAAAMFWNGRRILAGLLRRVERAVIILGNNVLDRRIRFKGPEDLQWLGRRLDWLRRRLRALEDERTRILRHVSHELKTPLAALREGASLLTEGVAGPLSPQQEKIAGIMQGNALRLQRLIDGLLKLQQAEHARESIAPVALRLDELVQQVLATHRLAARHKRLRITGTLAPLTVSGGQEEVTTIVDNLVSNAIKYSPEQGTIRLQLVRDDARAVLDVIDEGPGVPEDDRDRIFEPFYRGPGSKGVAGIGLGLAIARELAQAQRGTLDLLQAGAGARFRATLPLAEEAA